MEKIEEKNGYYAYTMEKDDLIHIEDKSAAISLRFVEQSNFIQTRYFKDFWIRYKMVDFEEW